MRICYLDAFSGISGDMTVGALIDAGAEAGEIVSVLNALGTGAHIRTERTRRNGIAALRFIVESVEQKRHRHLPQILDMIDNSQLSKRAKRSAAAVFTRLAEAEARVHNQPVEKVHFHEVGAVDSICDVVGACAAFDLLGIEATHCSPVNLGSGTVQTEHGVLPVPAPATAELLKGKPVYARGPAVELTTPTGAAIASALSSGFGAIPPIRLATTGYGAGTRDFTEHANVLRVIIGEASGATESVTVAVIEANIDDSTPQMLGFAMDRLLESGALDVTLSSVYMKKNRAGTLLQVIANPEDRERLAQIVLSETTTLGLRFYSAERRVKARKIVEVETRRGRVRMKISEDGSFAPEYEDCRRLAMETGVPLKAILAEAAAAYLNKKQ